jgi:hypothetical protein
MLSAILRRFKLDWNHGHVLKSRAELSRKFVRDLNTERTNGGWRTMSFFLSLRHPFFMAKPTVKPDRDKATETNLARKIAKIVGLTLQLWASTAKRILYR